MWYSVRVPSIASQIRQLHGMGCGIEEICGKTSTNSAYVRKVLNLKIGRQSKRRNVEDLLETLIHETRQTQSLLRLLLRQPRSPLERLTSDS